MLSEDGNGKNSFRNQFLAYLGEINSIDNLKYVFKNRPGISLTAIKDNFQQMFRGNYTIDGTYRYEFFDIIWSNQGLKNNLFPNPSNINESTHKINSKINFQNWVETQNNVLFSFIKTK